MADAASIIRAKLSNFPYHGARDGAAVYKITGEELGTILDELTRAQGPGEAVAADIAREAIAWLDSGPNIGAVGEGFIRRLSSEILAATPTREA